MTVPNSNARKVVADKLGQLLAETYTLAFKTHGYHWNVVGPQFNDLHTLFGQQYAALYEAADELAERIRALGQPAPASYRQFADLSAITADGEVALQMALVERLRDGHARAARTAHDVIEIAEQQGDVSTADLATQRITEHDKAAWMLGSILG
jgi:starvation-inducible DNA-binding protein